jgi:hypothetical protein
MSLRFVAVAGRAKPTVRPRLSLERTSTGLARGATQVIFPHRGPSLFRPLSSNVRPQSVI